MSLRAGWLGGDTTANNANWLTELAMGAATLATQAMPGHLDLNNDPVAVVSANHAEVWLVTMFPAEPFPVDSLIE